MIRLQKYLRDEIGISRRHAEGLISQQKITVNGAVSKLGDQVDPMKDVVYCDGVLVKSTTSGVPLEYILMNKPAGCVTTRFDPQKRKTIYDYLPKDKFKLFSIGRLDLNTEGLLLLTNDGDLSYRLTHPKFETEKEYLVIVSGALSPSQKSEIEKGLKAPGLITSPCRINYVRQYSNRTELKLVIHEGQKREIRRIFKHFAFEVEYLKRIRISTLSLGDLKPGSWRELTANEVNLL